MPKKSQSNLKLLESRGIAVVPMVSEREDGTRYIAQLNPIKLQHLPLKNLGPVNPHETSVNVQLENGRIFKVPKKAIAIYIADDGAEPALLIPQDVIDGKGVIEAEKMFTYSSHNPQKELEAKATFARYGVAVGGVGLLAVGAAGVAPSLLQSTQSIGGIARTAGRSLPARAPDLSAAAPSARSAASATSIATSAARRAADLGSSTASSAMTAASAAVGTVRDAAWAVAAGARRLLQQPTSQTPTPAVTYTDHGSAYLDHLIKEELATYAREGSCINCKTLAEFILETEGYNIYDGPGAFHLDDAKYYANMILTSVANANPPLGGAQAVVNFHFQALAGFAGRDYSFRDGIKKMIVGPGPDLNPIFAGYLTRVGGNPVDFADSLDMSATSSRSLTHLRAATVTPTDIDRVYVEAFVTQALANIEKDGDCRNCKSVDKILEEILPLPQLLRLKQDPQARYETAKTILFDTLLLAAEKNLPLAAITDITKHYLPQLLDLIGPDANRLSFQGDISTFLAGPNPNPAFARYLQSQGKTAADFFISLRSELSLTESGSPSASHPSRSLTATPTEEGQIIFDELIKSAFQVTIANHGSCASCQSLRDFILNYVPFDLNEDQDPSDFREFADLILNSVANFRTAQGGPMPLANAQAIIQNYLRELASHNVGVEFDDLLTGPVFFQFIPGVREVAARNELFRNYIAPIDPRAFIDGLGLTTVPTLSPADREIPLPAPAPAARPALEPTPRLAPTVRPAPQPLVQPAPYPVPAAGPAPRPAPAVGPTPTPAARPAHAPQPFTSPAPFPIPAPVYQPAPAPQPAWVPAPRPVPAFYPAPAPRPVGRPAPQPAPAAGPEPAPYPFGRPAPLPQPAWAPRPVPAISPVPAPYPLEQPAPGPFGMPATTPRASTMLSTTPTPDFYNAFTYPLVTDALLKVQNGNCERCKTFGDFLNESGSSIDQYYETHTLYQAQSDASEVLTAIANLKPDTESAKAVIGYLLGEFKFYCESRQNEGRKFDSAITVMLMSPSPGGHLPFQAYMRRNGVSPDSVLDAIWDRYNQIVTNQPVTAHAPVYPSFVQPARVAYPVALDIPGQPAPVRASIVAPTRMEPVPGSTPDTVAYPIQIVDPSQPAPIAAFIEVPRDVRLPSLNQPAILPAGQRPTPFGHLVVPESGARIPFPLTPGTPVLASPSNQTHDNPGRDGSDAVPIASGVAGGLIALAAAAALIGVIAYRRKAIRRVPAANQDQLGGEPMAEPEHDVEQPRVIATGQSEDTGAAAPVPSVRQEGSDSPGGVFSNILGGETFPDLLSALAGPAPANPSRLAASYLASEDALHAGRASTEAVVEAQNAPPPARSPTPTGSSKASSAIAGRASQAERK